MRYYLCFFTIFLSGCLNVPFIPLVDNEKDLSEIDLAVSLHHQPAATYSE